ncbi:hypothetical protein Ato02nite_024560 [Paractinoplanes toevensis]|uniref:Uncharacterized protein n=1 Tax=Paractinoplanes toevensis TaxID=571911 RepID=A0A919W4Y9_9ACTN|nr:hypothetical protein Ato02nite_024560 [Actinoplanes toevensis]
MCRSGAKVTRLPPHRQCAPQRLEVAAAQTTQPIIRSAGGNTVAVTVYVCSPTDVAAEPTGVIMNTVPSPKESALRGREPTRAIVALVLGRATDGPL